MVLIRRLLTFISIVSVVVLFGCSNRNANQPATSHKTSASVLRVGYQKSDSMNLLRIRGNLEKRLSQQGVKTEFVSFPAGPQLLEAIGVGSIDLGSTGDAPAIFAQSAGVPLVYVANNPPGAGAARAILVPKDSPITSVAQLRGKKIAIQKGSGTHNFLIQALEKAGVAYKDIKPIYLAPPDARAAFDSGSLDAWAIWDPFLSIAVKGTGARVLIDGSGIKSAGGFYLSSREFSTQSPDLLKVALEEVEKSSRWSADNPRKAAELLSPHVGVDVDTLEKIQRRRPNGERFVGFRPIDEDVLTTQQQLADNFLRIGLLPSKVDVRKGVLTKEQYALITPQVKVESEKLARSH